MGLILAGILAVVLFGGIGLKIMINNDESIYYKPLFILAVVCLLSGICFGLSPVSGYEEPQIVSTTELVSLRDATVSEGKGSLFYISVSSTNSYTYYMEVDSDYTLGSQKAYKSKTISGTNVTIVEDDNYTDAKLVTYVRYGKKSFWTFALGDEKYEYVFYVPTGTIVRDVSLG